MLFTQNREACLLVPHFTNRSTNQGDRNPPNSNRGVKTQVSTPENRNWKVPKMASYSKNVDWLSLTFSHDFAFKRVFAFDSFVLIGKGQHGYRSMHQGLNTGMLVQSGSRDDMGTHVTLSGQTMQALRDNLELSDKAICARMIDYGGRASRIDLALTITSGRLTPHSLYRKLESGVVKTRARKWLLALGANGEIRGDTLYVGARESDKFFRCYDKRAEQGLVDGAAMIRLETELKNLHARAACHTVATSSASAAVNTIVGSFLEFEGGELEAAFSGEQGEFRSIERPKSNTEKWLLDQVAKALARESMTNPTIVRNLLAEFRKHRKGLEFRNDML